MAESAYIGNIEVWPNNNRRARNPADQKRLDAYWKRRDPKPKRTRPASAESMVVSAAKSRAKLALVKIVAIILVIVTLVVMVYLNNVYVDPNYLNIGLSLTRSYSRSTTLNLIQMEKEMQNTIAENTEKINDIYANSSAQASDFKLDRKGLSKERFSTENGYIPGFVEINEELLKVASEYGSMSLCGHNFDGLLYLAMANDESEDWMRDKTKTISSAYPSALVDIDGQNFVKQINELCFTIYFSNKSTYDLNVAYLKKSSNAPWIRDPLAGTTTEQGALSQCFSTGVSDAAIQGNVNEKTQLDAIKDTVIKYSGNTESVNAIYETCTGSKYPYWGSTISDYGDRWSIRDTATVLKSVQEHYSENFLKNYMYDGTPSAYEAICYAQLVHWYPSHATDSWGAEGFKGRYTTPNAALAHAHFLASETSINIIRQYAQDSISKGCYYKNDSILISMYKELDSAMEAAQVPIYVNGEQIAVLNETTIGNDMQAKHELPNILFNYILLEELFNEGNGGVSE